MKLIVPSFELRTWMGPLTPEDGIRLLRWIEWNARLSHRSEDAQTEDSWRRFLEAVVIKHGDFSVTEHSHVTAVMRIERGTSHEVVRHRLSSFTQESTRFVNYGKRGDIELIMPENLKPENEQSWTDAMAEFAENICGNWNVDKGRRKLVPYCLLAPQLRFQ